MEEDVRQDQGKQVEAGSQQVRVDQISGRGRAETIGRTLFDRDQQPVRAD
jgi:hypothetical protein